MKLARATFPLCAEAQRDAWLRPLLEHSVQFLLQEVGTDALEAVILTGSAARGEASVLVTDDGFRLLGDLEFIVIVRPPIDWPAVRRRMAALSHRATHLVGCEGGGASIEYGPAGTGYFRRTIRPCIFAYDLRTYGKVVWGRQDILTEIRPFGIEDIPPDDALKLVMNRMMEVALFEELASDATVCAVQDRAYHLSKVILDLAGSALTFMGQYIAPYRDRSGAFRSLLDAEPALRAALPMPEQFLTALDWAATCKLAPTASLLAPPHMIATAYRQVEWGRGLWLWEMQRLAGLQDADFGMALETYVSRESMLERLKGWMKFLRHPLRPAGALSWPRVIRLLRRASPQTLTYAAALLTQMGAAGHAGADWRQRLQSLSPVPILAQDPTRAAQEIGAVWQWLMRNN